jgi:hypothetical protein
MNLYFQGKILLKFYMVSQADHQSTSNSKY